MLLLRKSDYSIRSLSTVPASHPYLPLHFHSLFDKGGTRSWSFRKWPRKPRWSSTSFCPLPTYQNTGVLPSNWHVASVSPLLKSLETTQWIHTVFVRVPLQICYSITMSLCNNMCIWLFWVLWPPGVSSRSTTKTQVSPLNYVGENKISVPLIWVHSFNTGSIHFTDEFQWCLIDE